MPTEEQKTVDIDTSGPGAEIDIVEEKKTDEVEVKDESTETPKQETKEETKQEEVKEEPKEELKEGSKPKDEELETYSKGVQSRIAKLTRKMREAERREKAALDYAKAVESKRKSLKANCLELLNPAMPLLKLMHKKELLHYQLMKQG
jgi:hypothetical protein